MGNSSGPANFFWIQVTHFSGRIFISLIYDLRLKAWDKLLIIVKNLAYTFSKVNEYLSNCLDSIYETVTRVTLYNVYSNSIQVFYIYNWLQ